MPTATDAHTEQPTPKGRAAIVTGGTTGTGTQPRRSVVQQLTIGPRVQPEA